MFSRRDVTYGEYDVYITTYDTLKMEEAFFTETIGTWHTVLTFAFILCILTIGTLQVCAVMFCTTCAIGW